MARQNLGSLLGVMATEVASVGPTPIAPSTLVESPEARRVSVREATVGSSDTKPPLYLRFVRKETRLRDDQQDLLTQHARRLNRAKTSGPRITDNTLIRIAVDLLMTRIDSAVGDDEHMLFESLKQ